MSAKYTPGPWRTDGIYIWARRCSLPVCTGVSRGVTVEEQEANGRLMAAAPEMLQALIKLTARTVYMSNGYCSICAHAAPMEYHATACPGALALAAIRKAEEG